MNTARFHSVGAQLGIAFGLVLLLIVWFLGQDIRASILNYQNAQLAAGLNSGANQLIAGIYEILMERLATNNALQAEEPAGADTLKEISTRRSDAISKI